MKIGIEAMALHAPEHYVELAELAEARGVDPDKIWYFNRDHAWFAGFGPTGSPEVAMVVLVEHGGGGGKHAVPVAMRIVEGWQQLKAKRLMARTSAADDDEPGSTL